MATNFNFTGNLLEQKTVFLETGAQATKSTYDNVKFFWGDTPLLQIGTGGSDGGIEVLEYEKDKKKIQNIAVIGTIYSIYGGQQVKLFNGAVAFNDVLSDKNKDRLVGEVKRSDRVEGGYDPVQDILGLKYTTITLAREFPNATTGVAAFNATPDIFPGTNIIPTFGSSALLFFPGGKPQLLGLRVQLPDLYLGSVFDWYYQKKNKGAFNIPTFEEKEPAPGKPIDPKKPLKIGQLTGIAVEYNGLDRYLELNGKTDVNLFALANLTFDIARPRFIRIYDNKVEVSFETVLQYFDLGAVRINEIRFSLDTVKAEGKVSGEILVRVWNNLKLGGNFGVRLLRNETGVFSGAQISSAGIYADNLNILISTPESQIYLQRLGGQFENVPPLLPGQTFNLNGNAAVSLGPGFEVDFPDWLGGSKKGQGIYAVRLDGGITLKIPEGFDVNASLSMLGFTIGQNRTYLNIANAVRGWGTVLESRSQLTLPFNVFVFDGLFSVDARVNFTLRGTGSLRLPSFIPFTGNREFAGGGGIIKYAAPYSPNAQFRPEYGFVAAWINVPSPPFFGDRVGARVMFYGKLDLILGKDIDGFSGLGTVDSLDEFSQLATSDTLLTAYEQQQTGDPLPSRAFEVSQGRKWAAVSVRWLAKNNIENPSSLFELVAPDGTVYRDFATGTKVKLIEEMSSAQGISIGIINPDAGTWTVRQVTDVDLGPVQIKMYENSIAPVGKIEQVLPDTNGQWVDIIYSVADADSSSVKVDLYMDTDGKGQDGTLLTTLDFEPSTATGTYRLMLEGLPKGEYYFYIAVDDVEHVPTVRYFDNGADSLVNTQPEHPIGSLEIGQGNDLSVVSDLSANWIGDGKFLVTWSDTEKPQYYNIRWSDNPAGSSDNAIGTDYTGVQPTPGLATLYKEESGRFYHELIVDGFTEGELYRFQIQSVDSQNHLGATGKTSLAVAGNYSTTIALSNPDEWNCVAVVGQTYTTVVAQDTPNETKTVTPLVLPEGASYNLQTHQLIWQPTIEQLGEHWVQFKVENQFGDVYLETQRLQVLEYSLEQYQTIKLPEDFEIFESQQTNPINLNSIISYSENDDTLTISGNASASVNTQGGNDTLLVGAYTKGFGGAGNDTLQAVAGILPGGVYLDGGEGNDRISGSNGDDTLLGGNGDDVIQWSFGDDSIDGGSGTDTLTDIQFLDLTQSEKNSIKSIEIFQLADGGEVVLNQAALLALAPDNNTLYIEGQKGTVYLADKWKQQGQMTHGGHDFLLYRTGETRLAIEKSNVLVFQTGEVDTLFGQFSTEEFEGVLENVSTFTLSQLPNSEYSVPSEGFNLALSVDQLGGSGVVVLDILPEYQGINTILRQDPLTGDWSEFIFNSQVGAELIDSNQDGQYEQIRFHLKDGGFGDEDGLVNGRVQLTGLLAQTTPGLATPLNSSSFLNELGKPVPLTVRAVSVPDQGKFEFGLIKSDYSTFLGLPGAYNPTDEGWSLFVALDTHAVIFGDDEQSLPKPISPEMFPADPQALNRSFAQQVLASGRSLAPTEGKPVGTLLQNTIEDAYGLDPYILDLNHNVMYSDKNNNLEITKDSRGFTQVSAVTPNGKFAVEIASLPILAPGMDGTETPTEIQLYRAAAHNNTLGLYRLANAQGDIDINNDGIIDFKPGQDGYAAAAVNMTLNNDPLTGGVVLNTPDNFSKQTTTTTLQAGALYGMLIISDGSAQQFLQENPKNELGRVNTFFMYSEANPDNQSHFMRLGQSIYGVEDLFNRGDADYNDLLVNFNFLTREAINV
ncbi:DUF4114 domain-containing protein [Synechocystis sp. LKSZ1]|uniref:DUF4114 domain-containing protein n=1 Tax=Synechocystis sp. LKSZ1 TaxID=3144951 RepID=UPI00336C2A9C